jgi:hypothetical protein
MDTMGDLDTQVIILVIHIMADMGDTDVRI